MELQRETWQRELDTKYIGDNIPGGQMKLATENKIKCQQWVFFLSKWQFIVKLMSQETI